MSSAPLILLDRDGVLNEDRVDYVKSLEELVLIPEALQALALLKQAGYRIAVCTNQSCLDKGILSHDQLAVLHAEIQRRCDQAIDRFYVAPDAVPSPRRKPAPGMLLEALEDFQAEAAHTWFIGDALRDLEAGKSAGCQPILVRTGKGRATEQQGWPESLEPVRIYDNLLVAVKNLL